jgi:hypothetical protein
MFLVGLAMFSAGMVALAMWLLAEGPRNQERNATVMPHMPKVTVLPPTKSPDADPAMPSHKGATDMATRGSTLPQFTDSANPLHLIGNPLRAANLRGQAEVLDAAASAMTAEARAHEADAARRHAATQAEIARDPDIKQNTMAAAKDASQASRYEAKARMLSAKAALEHIEKGAKPSTLDRLEEGVKEAERRAAIALLRAQAADSNGRRKRALKEPPAATPEAKRERVTADLGHAKTQEKELDDKLKAVCAELEGVAVTQPRNSYVKTQEQQLQRERQALEEELEQVRDRIRGFERTLRSIR